MAMKNIFGKSCLSVLIVFSFISLASANLNLTISGTLSNSSTSFSSDFRALSQTGAVVGLEGYDSLSPSLSTGYASFSSVITGNLHLGVDAYNTDSTRNREMNLSFRTSPAASGELVLNWTVSEVYYDFYLTYYGNDSTRTDNESQRINLETESSYTDTSLSGTGYFKLEIFYYPPANVVDDLGGGGSGGGGSGINPLLVSTCNDTIICDSWNVCQNLEYSFKETLIVEGDYLTFKKECNSKGYDSEICGFQSRSCKFVEECVNSSLVPIPSQSCYYVINPSCEDNIRNCHDGSCEILADCGGPCSPCPTCSDGIKNQGEKKVDCEGPCPNICERDMTDFISEIEGRQILSVLLYGFVIVVITAAILFLIYYIKKIKKRVQYDQYSWYNLK